MRDQIDTLEASGWNNCESVKASLLARGLCLPTAQHLKQRFSSSVWKQAERAAAALREHFRNERFAEECEFGPLLIPNPAKLDTRGPLPASIRRDQSPEPLQDLVDKRLPNGKTITRTEHDWTLAVTVTGPFGISVGSYDDIMGDPPERFTVFGVDTRPLMVRQVWGARVLQAGANLPDSTVQKKWTFTLFPGEGTVDGCACSGTILHGKVRVRLGRTDRGIGSARVCPALVIA